MPPTTTSNGWLAARPRPRTVKVPFDVARSASTARPLARGALAVATSGVFTTLAPCAGGVESTTAAALATSAAARFRVTWSNRMFTPPPSYGQLHQNTEQGGRQCDFGGRAHAQSSRPTTAADASTR